MLLSRRSYGVFSITRSSAVPPPSGTHVHQPQAKRARSFSKYRKKKKKIYPALMSSGGFQALSAHTAETELKVLGQLLVKKKKKKAFPPNPGCLGWCFNRSPCRGMAQRLPERDFPGEILAEAENADAGGLAPSPGVRPDCWRTGLRVLSSPRLPEEGRDGQIICTLQLNSRTKTPE